MKKPNVKFSGRNGNVFGLIGIAQNALREAGQKEQAKEMYDEVTKTAKSYDEALQIMAKYVNIR